MRRETQRTINAWQDATFPNATTAGVTRHLLEELDELKAALERLEARARPVDYGELFEAAFEAADVIILIYAWAKKNGITDIHVLAVDHKMAINRRRDWNVQPDGTGRHR